MDAPSVHIPSKPASSPGPSGAIRIFIGKILTCLRDELLTA